MCRDYVRRSGLVYFFLDPDAAECGTCRARTKGQIYWYIVRPNYSEFGPHISGGLPEHLQRIIGKVSFCDDELDTIADKLVGGAIIFVSDGSVANGQGTSAYKIVDPNEPALFIIGSAPCDSNPSCIQSFRAELNGILGEIILSGEILRYTGKDQQTAAITTFCDNISALGKLKPTDEPPGIRGKLGPDYDIIHEIHRSLEKYGINVSPKHVKGHQDRDKTHRLET